MIGTVTSRHDITVAILSRTRTIAPVSRYILMSLSSKWLCCNPSGWKAGNVLFCITFISFVKCLVLEYYIGGVLLKRSMTNRTEFSNGWIGLEPWKIKVVNPSLPDPSGQIATLSFSLSAPPVSQTKCGNLAPTNRCPIHICLQSSRVDFSGCVSTDWLADLWFNSL